MGSVYDDFDPEEYHDSVFMEMDRAMTSAQHLRDSFEKKMKAHAARMSRVEERTAEFDALEHVATAVGEPMLIPAPPAGMGCLTPLGIVQSAAYQMAREPDGLIPKTMREMKSAIEHVKAEVRGYARTPPEDRRFWRMWEETERALDEAMAQATLMNKDVVALTIKRVRYTDYISQ